MEVRCGKCNKLFRVADDKITGSGIKFRCTRCSEYVKITREDFEVYRISRASASAASETAPVKAGIQPSLETAATSFSVPEAEQSPFEMTSAPEPVSGPGPTIELTGYDMSDLAMPKAELHEPEHPATEPTAPQPQPVRIETSKPAVAPQPAPASKSNEAVIHPFVSGSTVGAAAGLGCALPITVVTLLGIGALSAFIKGPAADLPLWYSVLIAALSMMGFGIVIGVVLAMIQAGADRRIFSVGGVLVGAFLSALIGAVQGAAVALGSDAVMSAVLIAGSAVGWAVKGILLSIVVVIIRRTMMTGRKESFSSGLSGAQVLWLVLAAAIVAAGVYSEVMSASALKTAKEQTVGAVQEMVTPEGLQVGNLSGYIDQNGDIVLTGVIENTTEKEKPVWYLVAEVYDAQGGVLAKAKLLNGRQLYSMRDYDILAKRGADVKAMREQAMRDKGAALQPKAVVNFEMRIIEPPVGIASFLVTPQPFDPVQMLKDMAEDMKHMQAR